jgi:hypothetical protein
MKIYELLEALKPSEYRKYVKGWDKTKYEDIFGGKYRIELPTPDKDRKQIKPDPYLDRELMLMGYEIHDYTAGLAKSLKTGRIIRIGKLITDPDLIKRFANDPARSGSNTQNKEYRIIISRHPYDIAGMSTNRGWSSCMNINVGSNRKYVAVDVKEGTIIAYLVKRDDNNIERPVARVLIKPFINSRKDVALGVNGIVYGTAPPWFANTVVEWANNINKSRKLKGIFSLHPDMYNDDDEPFLAVGTEVSPQDVADEIEKSPGLILYLLDNGYINEGVLLACANCNTYMIQEILQAGASSTSPLALTEAVQIAWCNRSDDNAGDVLSLLFEYISYSTEGISEKAILTALQHDYKSVYTLREHSYTLTEEMIKVCKNSLLESFYSEEDWETDEMCNLINAFRKSKLQIPSFALSEIAKDGEAALYYVDLFKTRFKQGEAAMVQYVTEEDNAYAEMEDLLRYAVMLYRKDKTKPEEILDKLQQNQIVWLEYTNIIAEPKAG